MIELNQLEKYIISKKDKIQISSKDIKSGDIFLALKGKRFHGNKFLNEAIDKGAKFCVTDNKNFKKNKKILYVNNIYKYLSKIAKTKRDLYKGKVIGITGSAGKTTLKETLAFFLKKDHTISYSKKSYNNQLGVLISLLNLNLKSNYAIFEIGTNNFGEIKKLTKNKHYNFLETLAEDVFDELFKDKRIDKISLQIEKLEIMKDCASVGIQISKKRSHEKP